MIDIEYIGNPCCSKCKELINKYEGIWIIKKNNKKLIVCKKCLKILESEE